MTRRLARRVAPVLGAAAIVAVWAIAAASRPAVLLPSPIESARSLGDLIADGELWPALAPTAARAAGGTGLAVAIGLLLGIVAAHSQLADGFLRPLRALLVGIPPIVTVIVVATWLGTDPRVAVIVAALSRVPDLAIATTEAVRAVDRDLDAMATAFGVPGRWRLRHLTIPAIAPPVTAAAATALAGSLRLTLMAELLTSPTGIGAELARARTNLDTPRVFAWTLVAVAFAFTLELAVLALTRRRAEARDQRYHARG